MDGTRFTLGMAALSPLGSLSTLARQATLVLLLTAQRGSALSTESSGGLRTCPEPVPGAVSLLGSQSVTLALPESVLAQYAGFPSAMAGRARLR
ncbi:MAG TPA: hypothetical protein VGF67_26370 [Ktedonobacteraceae bacterium]